MLKTQFQCDHFSCLECYDEPQEVCGKCGGTKFNEIGPPTCDKCGYIYTWEEGEPWTDKDKLIYIGPSGSLCEDCVPRVHCSCNTFETEEEAKSSIYGSDKTIIKQDKYGNWIYVDEKGKLLPCVDWS